MQEQAEVNLQSTVPWRAYPFLLTVIAVLTLTEYAFVFIQSVLGVVLSTASVVVLFGIVSLRRMGKQLSDVVENVSLLFLYILLITSLPWFFFSQSFLIPGVYTLVLSLCFWRIYSRRLTFAEVGLVRTKLSTTLVLSVAGIPLGIVEFLILRPAPLFPSFQVGYLLQTSLYMLVFVALGEELLFRGLIQNSLVRYFGAWQGILVASVIFGIMHTVWRSPIEIVFTFAAGLMLGYVYHKTGSLAASIGIHTLDNVLMLAIMPYIL